MKLGLQHLAVACYFILPMVSCETSRDCPELHGWEPFTNAAPFRHMAQLPQCVADIEPTMDVFTSSTAACPLVPGTNPDDYLFSFPTCAATSVLRNVNKIVFIVHGWLDEQAKTGWQTEMKDSLLAAHSPDSLAVVIVGWYKGAGGNTIAAAGWWNGVDLSYQQAVPNTRYMGVAISRVMQQLVAGHTNSSGLELHCVGHSLGAQICGFTGKAVKKDRQNNPDTVLGRISGLDPAGPSFMKDAWFEPGAGHSFSAAGRLNPTDAAVVDVIHTDGGSACSEVPYSGTVDFYPGADSSSYGTAQPGCHDDMCDHMQVVYYYISSIVHHSSCGAVDVCQGYVEDRTLSSCSPTSSPRPRMGYWYDGAATGMYGVRVRGQEPFCYRCVDSEDCSAGEECQTAGTECAPGAGGVTTAEPPHAGNWLWQQWLNWLHG